MDKRKEKIYILLLHSKTIPAKIVKLFTRYKYSHVALAIDKDCEKIYSFGRKKLNNPFIGGFVIENKDGKFFSKFNSTICKIYEVDVSEEQKNNILNKLSYMKQNERMYKYDFLGLFLRMLNIKIKFKNKYVCSSFVSEILEKNNIYHFENEFVKPKDFECLNFKVIYEGLYNEYNLTYVV